MNHVLIHNILNVADTLLVITKIMTMFMVTMTRTFGRSVVVVGVGFHEEEPLPMLCMIIKMFITHLLIPGIAVVIFLFHVIIGT